MKILKFLQYAYLVFFAIFLYDGISKWSIDRQGAYVSLFFAALALFLYFFRKKFRKRFEERGKL
ncbi:MAG: hypothetical protein KJO49_11640 [Bacteroidia bacterium]|nr:hypothetical protein [Bacteroidia bacterium]MBT8267652.1 hypothetical protein [Bacteroidia bacterium]NNF83051.1 hypothetical protein [Flavobacteriaceae bacterium]NNK69659.1 hypothetical protein [Flavobacteriaceae bacterium]